MQSQRINITLPQVLITEIAFSVPAGKRSQFIAQAVKEKLKTKKSLQKKLQESLVKNKAFYKKIATEWKNTETSDWPDL